MPRFFRIYGKKRGDRRTGSPTLGSAGEALFFGFFLTLGVCSLVWLMVRWVMPEWHVYHGFTSSKCAVLERAADGQPGHRLDPLEVEGRPHYQPKVAVRYPVDGVPREGWAIYDYASSYMASREEAQAILDRFPAGPEYDCWYDASDPTTVVLSRGVSWGLWVALLAPISFIAIGGAGVIRSLFLWGRSAEHRSADLRRVAEIIPLEGTAAATQLPHVPHATNLTNSPGTTLAYRLPTTASPSLRVFALGTASVVWNGIMLTLLVLFLTGSVTADPAWPLWLVFSMAIPAGWGLVYLFVRQLLLTSGAGPTLVEISDHPLLPGERYEVFLSQTGKLTLKNMQLDLECEEEATYRQGTDTRTDRRRVFQQTLWRREQFEIEQGLPFEVRCELRLPAHSMHSFKALYNEVRWRLVVRAEVTDWPGFERIFPVIVHPRGRSRRRMNEPRVSIHLTQETGLFTPGENLTGEIIAYDLTASEIRAIELSILWYTEGKGEEELGVHYFERVVPAQVTGFDPRTPRPFSVKLPRSPLSYDGVIVNIRWCVRVRVFPTHGREVLAERTFQLGAVPPAQAVLP